MTAVAAATLGLATPASAAILFQDFNGPDLDTMIKASKTNTQNDNVQVFGSTTNDGSSANVTFTGLLGDQATGTKIHITDGAGFASITDEDGAESLYNLIVDVDQDFTAYQFSIQLINDGTVSIYYMLAGGSGWTLATGSPIDQKANTNNQYLLSGGTFSAIMISSNSPIDFVKQNSITLAGSTPSVPEPATWGLMLLGFGGMGFALRRGRRRNATLMQIA